MRNLHGRPSLDRVRAFREREDSLSDHARCRVRGAIRRALSSRCVADQTSMIGRSSRALIPYRRGRRSRGSRRGGPAPPRRRLPSRAGPVPSPSSRAGPKSSASTGSATNRGWRARRARPRPAPRRPGEPPRPGIPRTCRVRAGLRDPSRRPAELAQLLTTLRAHLRPGREAPLTGPGDALTGNRKPCSASRARVCSRSIRSRRASVTFIPAGRPAAGRPASQMLQVPRSPGGVYGKFAVDSVVGRFVEKHRRRTLVLRFDQTGSQP